MCILALWESSFLSVIPKFTIWYPWQQVLWKISPSRTSSCTWEEGFSMNGFLLSRLQTRKCVGSLWLPEPASMKWLEPLISSAQSGSWLVTLTEPICSTTCWWIVSESWTSVDLFVFQFPIQFQELEQQWIKCRFRVQEFRGSCWKHNKVVWAACCCCCWEPERYCDFDVHDLWIFWFLRKGSIIQSNIFQMLALNHTNLGLQKWNLNKLLKTSPKTLNPKSTTTKLAYHH